MSNMNWPEFGIGIVLRDKEIEAFLERNGYRNECDFTEAVEDADHAVRYYDYNFCEGLCFTSETKGISDEPESMLAFWALNQLRAFEPAYESVEDVVNEFKESELGKLFPDDFDWEAHFGLFSCSIYC